MRSRCSPRSAGDPASRERERPEDVPLRSLTLPARPEQPMIVVKVGGSLYDHPRLGPGLRAYLDALAPDPVLLVPGGGPFADAVRQLDAAHRLGEEAAHWLALMAMTLAGGFLQQLLGDAPWD